MTNRANAVVPSKPEPTEMPINDLELGQLLQRVETMEKQLAEQGKTLTEVRDAIVKAKGGWWTLVVVGSVASAITTFVMKMLPH